MAPQSFSIAQPEPQLSTMSPHSGPGATSTQTLISMPMSGPRNPIVQSVPFIVGMGVGIGVPVLTLCVWSIYLFRKLWKGRGKLE